MSSTSTVTFHPAQGTGDEVFSILIPTWNNLTHLKCCVESIRKNSSMRHQIIVHLNEGSDGSLEWVRSQGLDYTKSDQNVGVCYGFNAPSALARCKYILLSDDDFYFAPGWDESLLEEIQKAPSLFCISGTMIEHTKSRNNCAIAPHDFGKTAQSFDEARFLREYMNMPFGDWNGSNWYPLVMPRSLWILIGGLSVEFSPGMGSDPDMMMKLWHAGVRYYKGVSCCRVYHFGSKTTSRIVHNNANKQFLHKWNISISTLYKFTLRMGEPFAGTLTGPGEGSDYQRRIIRDRIKKMIGLS